MRGRRATRSPRRVLLVGIAGALSLGLTVSCAAPEPTAAPAPAAPELRRLHGQAFGTTWQVSWTGAVDEAAVTAAVTEALETVDAAMSTWRDDSELMAVREGDGPVRVSAETAEVVRRGLALAEATGGAFDPTVQPLVEMWGFHGTPRAAWPTDDELAAARAQVGWERVQVRHDAAGAATVDAGGTALDLSAIAKGHGVDRVAHAVAALGAVDVFVEIGGEVRTFGRSPRGTPWVVGVERPKAGGVPGRDLVATVAVSNAALATSGNYRTAFALDGRTVHHTLDPRTGLPSAARVLSASVLAPDCATADGWATALMVLGADAGLPLIEARPELEAWLVVPGEEGPVSVGTTGFSARLVSDTLADPPAGD